MPGTHYYYIEFKDNDIGFEQYAETTFNIFHRLHGRGEYEGLGVGLSIARKLMENHWDRMCEQWKAGDGATFTALLHYNWLTFLVTTTLLSTAKKHVPVN